MPAVTNDKEKLTTEYESGAKRTAPEAVSIKIPGRVRVRVSKWSAETLGLGVGHGFFKWMPFQTKVRTVLWLEGTLLLFILAFTTISYVRMDAANDEVLSLAGAGLSLWDSTGLNETDINFIKAFGLAFPVIEEEFKLLQIGALLCIIRVVATFWLLVSGISGASKWKLRTWMVIAIIHTLVLTGFYCLYVSDPENGVFNLSLINILIIAMRVLVIYLVSNIIAEFKKREEKAAAGKAKLMGSGKVKWIIGDSKESLDV